MCYVNFLSAELKENALVEVLSNLKINTVPDLGFEMCVSKGKGFRKGCKNKPTFEQCTKS